MPLFGIEPPEAIHTSSCQMTEHSTKSTVMSHQNASSVGGTNTAKDAANQALRSLFGNAN